MDRIPYLLAVTVLSPVVLTAQWRFSQSKDEITDKVSYAFSASSEDMAPNAVGIPARALLVLRCEDGRPSALFVTTNMYIGDAARVQYRLDQRPAIEDHWDGGRARDALFFGGTAAQLDRLTALLQSSSRLLFRWFPPMEESRTVRFHIAGLGAFPLGQLKACGLDAASRSQRAAEVAEAQRAQAARTAAARWAAGKEQRAADSAAKWHAKMLDSLQTRDTLLPWVGEVGSMHYWRNSPKCARHREAYPANRIFFREAKDAEFTGRFRVPARAYPDC